MSDNELIRKWLWMETMNYALEIINEDYKRYVYPDYESRRLVDYDESLKNIFTYALENWHAVSFQGRGSGHCRHALGYDNRATSKGVSGEFRTKGIEVNITWLEVQRFIKTMLSPVIQDRQITLLELLAEQATAY